MKKFLLKTILFLFLVVLTPILLFLIVPANKKTYGYEIYGKYERLENLKSPKIVFIGGSNAAFGIDSKKIEKTFNVPVVNMGHRAGNGIRLPIKTISPQLRKNDIAVFMFEYGCFCGKYNLAEILEPAQFHKEYLFLAEEEEHRNIISDIPGIACANLIGMFFPPRKSRAPYFPKMNEQCDHIAHLDLPSKKFKPSKNLGKFNQNRIQFFTEKIKELRSRDVNVIILPCTFQKSSYENCKDSIKKLAEEFSKNEIPYQADTERYALADELYFDTPYHLNKKGREIRTQLLIEDLKRILN